MNLRRQGRNLEHGRDGVSSCVLSGGEGICLGERCTGMCAEILVITCRRQEKTPVGGNPGPRAHEKMWIWMWREMGHLFHRIGSSRQHPRGREPAKQRYAPRGPRHTGETKKQPCGSRDFDLLPILIGNCRRRGMCPFRRENRRKSRSKHGKAQMNRQLRKGVRQLLHDLRRQAVPEIP